jgi:hypothetical protein
MRRAPQSAEHAAAGRGAATRHALDRLQPKRVVECIKRLGRRAAVGHRRARVVPDKGGHARVAHAEDGIRLEPFVACDEDMGDQRVNRAQYRRGSCRCSRGRASKQCRRGQQRSKWWARECPRSPNGSGPPHSLCERFWCLVHTGLGQAARWPPVPLPWTSGQGVPSSSTAAAPGRTKGDLPPGGGCRRGYGSTCRSFNSKRRASILRLPA